MGYNIKPNYDKFNKQLRQFFDADDPVFFALAFPGGNRSGGRGGRRSNTWVDNPKKIKEVLLRSFPKLRSDPRQHAAAARWMLFIYLYWRCGLTHGKIVLELNQVKWGQENSPKVWNLNKVRSLLHRIRRAADPNHQHRGRPRKTKA